MVTKQKSQIGDQQILWGIFFYFGNPIFPLDHITTDDHHKATFWKKELRALSNEHRYLFSQKHGALMTFYATKNK